MITIHKCTDEDRICNSCLARDKTKLFHFNVSNRSSNTDIILCAECLGELHLYLSTKMEEIVGE